MNNPALIALPVLCPATWTWLSFAPVVLALQSSDRFRDMHFGNRRVFAERRADHARRIRLTPTYFLENTGA